VIADDFSDAREMAAAILEFYGYRTEAAQDGYEAIEKALEGAEEGGDEV
jgi:CheY-like chemotaxis protein